jgi:glutamine cyclotransferase
LLKKIYKKNLCHVFILSALLTPFFTTASEKSSIKTAVIEYQYRVVTSYPHSTTVFTQGLEFHQGILFESAGKRGESRLIKRRLENTEPIQIHNIDDQYFSEGLTLLKEKLYQLTWESQQGFIYNPKTLEAIGKFTINGQGWGMTNNGSELIISNGTSQLSFIHPESFAVIRSIDVHFEKKPVKNLNELEWVNGVIYANIWQSNWIIMIDPANGNVIGKVLMNNLLPRSSVTTTTDVLNGIAYDHVQKRLLVTGKYWPKIYHIELTPLSELSAP